MLHVFDAGVVAYRAAWERQLQFHDQVLAGEYAAGVLMLVEHSPVVTVGRRPGAEKHVLAGEKLLAARGVETVETDRGGDVTFHGPGQLVAYPIVPLNGYGLNLHSYLRLMEEVVIGVLEQFGVSGMRDTAEKVATGVWVEKAACKTSDAACGACELAKICAMGIKVRRWVTLHGLALNVTTDLSFFDLINPCGLSRPVTSMKMFLGEKCPTMAEVKGALALGFERELAPLWRAGVEQGQST